MIVRKESSFYKEMNGLFKNIFFFKVLIIVIIILVKKGKFGLRDEKNEVNMFLFLLFVFIF